LIHSKVYAVPCGLSKPESLAYHYTSAASVSMGKCQLFLPFSFEKIPFYGWQLLQQVGIGSTSKHKTVGKKICTSLSLNMNHPCSNQLHRKFSSRRNKKA
jgi:hypothetical protein